MRLSLTLIVLLFSAATFGNPTFKKLNELNKCWAEQKDIQSLPLSALTANSETDWIKLHLSLVEQTLRARNTSHLSPRQKTNRLNALAHLNVYRHVGAFPQNEEFTYRLPIFIDKYDNFCAVGYLVKATGYEAVSRKIQAQTNYAYVREMKYPELFAWADEYGFTVDELAWIQPTYAPTSWLQPMGKGTNGVVQELFADNATQRLYVGGTFSYVDSSIGANNIAYLTENNNVYTWNSLGNGLNGPVYAIEKYGSNIFVGGSFTMSGSTPVTNVAYWNGSSWQSAGCINGSVKDLIVFQGNLYAAGQFGVCNPATLVSFAKWTGSGWQGIPGLTGKVNTMEVRDSFLLLGGAFSYNGNAVNAIKWNPNSGFQTFGNTIRNEVNDFAIYYDTVYAMCKHTAIGDTTLFKKLKSNNQWDSIPFKLNYENYLTLNTGCVSGDTFLVGGDFNNMPIFMGTPVYNCITPVVQPFPYGSFFNTDSAINKMVVFKNAIIAGGMFKGGGYYNGIGKKVSLPPVIFPPIVKASASKSCDSTNTGTAFAYVTTGTPPIKYLWSTGDTTQLVNNLAPGSYSVIVTDKTGLKDTAYATVKATMIDTAIKVASNMLTANTAQAQYQWINCADNSDIPGANNIFYIAVADGSYAVRISLDSCTMVSACYSVKLTSVEELEETGVSIYPNPVGDELTISLDKTAGNASIALTDIMGKTLIVQQYANTGSIKVNTSMLPRGVYFLKLDADGKMSQYKLVKD